MFQWLYDFFMTYIMPMVVSVMSLLGVDMKNSVKFAEDTKDAPSDEPVAAVDNETH